MKIIKTYEEVRYGIDNYTYFIQIKCKENNDRDIYPFLRLKQVCEESSNYLNVHKFVDKAFLEENKIEYLSMMVGDKEKIIPIGIVDFLNEETHFSGTLQLKCDKYDDLYKVNQIIDLIEEAVKIKYEAIVLINKTKKEEEVTMLQD